MNSVDNAAKTMTSWQLIHVRRTLESELIAAANGGVRGTQQHVGKIEMMEACSRELEIRGVRPTFPVDVAWESAPYGPHIKLTFSVRVF